MKKNFYSYIDENDLTDELKKRDEIEERKKVEQRVNEWNKQLKTLYRWLIKAIDYLDLIKGAQHD